MNLFGTRIIMDLLSSQVTNLPIFKIATNALAGELSNAMTLIERSLQDNALTS